MVVKCPFCPREFENERGLRTHISNKHREVMDMMNVANPMFENVVKLKKEIFELVDTVERVERTLDKIIEQYPKFEKAFKGWKEK